MGKGTTLDDLIEQVQGIALRALLRAGKKYFVDTMLGAAAREVIELQRTGKVDARP
jgi:hypothetical protein